MAKGFVIRKRDFPQAWGWISGMYKLYTGTNKNPVFVQGAFEKLSQEQTKIEYTKHLLRSIRGI